MSLSVLAIILFAAFLHAFWNAIVKGAGDKSVVLGFIALGHVVPGIVMVQFSSAPLAGAWPYLIASTVIHWAYYYLLTVAYRVGDFSIVYPIARGLAPVLIALGAQFWIGETLPLPAWVGIVLVSLGIMVLTRGTLRSGLPLVGIVAALGVAFTIALYSIVDGIGVRLSQNAVGYIGWLFIAEILVVAFVFTTRWERVRTMSNKTMLLAILGGIVSSAAYGLVLYAKTLAPLGVVSALRETSVIFAAIIGVVWFGEGPQRDRLLAASIVALGIVIIAFVG